MQKTLILQSHTSPLPASWLTGCIESIKARAALRGYRYQFLGDELFDYVPVDLCQKTKAQPAIAIDLARLRALQFYLTEGFDAVVWCDADCLIFAPQQFALPTILSR